jgi:hypothetical protein
MDWSGVCETVMDTNGSATQLELRGFVSRVPLVSDERFGIVVLTNAEDGGPMDLITYHLLDHYLNVPPSDWSKAFRNAEVEEDLQAANVMKKQTGWRADNSSSSLALEKYAGVYKDA